MNEPVLTAAPSKPAGTLALGFMTVRSVSNAEKGSGLGDELLMAGASFDSSKGAKVLACRLVGGWIKL
jgi:hypothetical protein